MTAPQVIKRDTSLSHSVSISMLMALVKSTDWQGKNGFWSQVVRGGGSGGSRQCNGIHHAAAEEEEEEEEDRGDGGKERQATVTSKPDRKKEQHTESMDWVNSF